MDTLVHKLRNRSIRKNRVRARIIGTSERPRLCVRISNRHISAQIIDDSKHHTIASVTTVGAKNKTSSMTESAAWIGDEISKKAKAAKVTTVVFDRGSKLYNGRVQALADAARNGGLEL